MKPEMALMALGGIGIAMSWVSFWLFNWLAAARLMKNEVVGAVIRHPDLGSMWTIARVVSLPDFALRGFQRFMNNPLMNNPDGVRGAVRPFESVIAALFYWSTVFTTVLLVYLIAPMYIP